MPKIVDHDQYRKELLEKSFDLFAEKGYASITMRDIAQGLSVSTGTLYHYFPSKQSLFEQLVEWMSQEDILTATTELQRVQTLQERIEVIGQLISKEENYNYVIKQTLILVDFYQQHPEMRGSELTQRVNGWYRQGVAELLGVTDPEIAQSVISFIGGLIIERLTGNQTISFTEQMALFGKMLTAYLEQQVEQPNHQVPSTKRGKKP